MYACPEGLDPRGAAVIDKRVAREQGLTWTGAPPVAHPMYEYRKVPTAKLKQRLDVLMFRDEAPMRGIDFAPASVRISLVQHLGAPAVPTVGEGQRVRRGDLLGRPGGKVSTAVHASIDGVVTKITKTDIHVQRS
jgi:hypothetical protein